ncbi:hypothetical protein PMAYCL1PPCAC_03554, partial [Pristionchus mayeri]
LELVGVGRVNAYFHDVYDVFMRPLETLLANYKYRDHRVLFTGHSIGGAFATLAAVKTHVKRLRPPHEISLITFGAPRVGDAVFAHVAEVIWDSWRVVNGSDPVPHHP